AMPATARRIAMRHAGSEAALGVVALPPFAALKADITLLGQQLRQRGRAANVLQHLAAIGSLRRIVTSDQVLVRIKARDDRHQAGPAEARGRIAAGEDDTLRSEPIQVRRLNLRVAHEAVVAPSLIV